MTPGPKPRPVLQLVREGVRPSRIRAREGAVVPPAELPEPDWLETWPPTRDRELQRVNARAREVARREWRRVVPVLKVATGLGAVDATILWDYCVCVARLDQCNRDISMRGALVKGRGGVEVKNPLATMAAQYRTQIKVYIGELGLSPSARTRLAPGGDNDDGDDPFAPVG